jgi:cardiolipin synthase
MTGPLHPKYQFPWRPGNNFELLCDGRMYFPRMLDAIAHAREYVLLEIYLFESGVVASRFIDAFAQAAGRGVTIKVLSDDFGASGLTRIDRDRLHAAGAELAFYNPLRYRKLLANAFRDHRKLLIVDGTVAFVSGTGLTDEFDDPHHPQRSWRETAVRITGPVLADWVALFDRAWRHHARSALALPPVPANAMADGMRGRVVPASRLAIQDIRRSLYRRVRNAEHRVWLSTAYFVPSRKLLRAFMRAARQGADVRLLLPGPHTDHPAVRHAGRRYYARLLRHGVRVFEYQPRFLHAKTLLCDRWVSVGSSNFDRWNLRWNLEANQEVDDQRFTDAVAAMFVADFEESVEIDLAHWRRRRWIARMRERFWGRVDMALERLGRRRVRRP